MKLIWFYGSIGKFFVKDPTPIIEDSFSVYSLFDNVFKWKLSKVNFVSWNYLNSEIIAKLKSGEIITLDKSRSNVENDLLLNSPVFLGEYIVAIKEVSWREKLLIAFNTSTGESKQVCGRYTGVSSNGKIICSKERKELVAFDSNLNELWRIDLFTARSYGTLNSHKQGRRYFIDNLIVVNQGFIRESEEGRVVAINNQDGTEAWHFSYRGQPEYSFLQNDKYFIVLDGEILVLNALSGKLEQIICPNLGKNIIISLAGDNLFIGSNNTKTLSIYSLSEKKAKTKKPLPAGFIFSLTGFPNKSNQQTYFELKQDHEILKFGSSCLLAVPNSGELEDIELENRLEMPMIITIDAKGEKTYLFTVSCDSLDDLRRLAAITLAECAYTYGEPAGVPVSEIDKKHKGKMKVVVDQSVLPSDAEEKLKEWASDLSAHFTKLAMFPGAGQKHRFIIEIEMS